MEVTVIDAASAPVEDADVTIVYQASGETATEITDETGVAVFFGQPVGAPAIVSAEDFDDRHGETASAGFAAGTNRLTVTVR